MKKMILIIASISILCSCGASFSTNDISTGHWVIKDAVYGYDSAMSNKIMLLDFNGNFGKNYEILSVDSESDLIICKKKEVK